MSKDLTPYAKSKFQIKIFMDLYKNIRLVSSIIFVLIVAILVIGWFMYGKDVDTFIEWILASVIVSLILTAFFYVAIRFEKNPYKLSWILFGGMISFSIGVVYNLIEIIRNNNDGLTLEIALLMSIWSMIVLQKFAIPKYEEALSDSADGEDDLDNTDFR